MAHLSHLELWTNYEFASGTRLYYLPPPLKASVREYLESQLIEMAVLTVTWANGPSPLLYVYPPYVLRVVYVDGTLEEFRITRSRYESITGNTTTVTAQSVMFDLGHGDKLVTQPFTRNIVTQYSMTGTIDEVMTEVGKASPSAWFEWDNTGAPTDTVTVTWDRSTCLAGVIAVAEAHRRLSTGTAYYVRLNRDAGTSYYQWQFTTGSVGPTLRVGRNLNGITRDITLPTDYGNRIVPFGEGDRHCGVALWRVHAVSAGSYIELSDVLGTTGGPLIEDDALNGKYVLPPNMSTGQVITDSAVVSSLSRLSMTTTTAFAVGDYVALADDATGAQLIYVDKPSLQTSGIRMLRAPTDYPVHTNFLLNPDFTDGATSWTSTTNWSLDDTMYRTGKQSYKAGAIGTGTFLSQTASHDTAAGTWAFTVWWKTSDNSGTAALEYVSAAGPTWTTGQALNISSAVPDQWNRTDFVVALTAATPRTLGVRLNFTGAPTSGTFWVDAYQITRLSDLVLETDTKPTASTANVLPPVPDFVRGSGAATIWNWSRQAFGNSWMAVELDAVDLYNADPDRYPYEQLTLGDTVTALGEELTVIRILYEKTRNLLEPLQTQLVVGAPRRSLSLTSQLADR